MRPFISSSWARRSLSGLAALAVVATLVSPAFAYPRPGENEWLTVPFGGGQPNGSSDAPIPDATGHFIAFDSVASNLVPGDTNERRDVFVHDRLEGTTERVSLAHDGSEGRGNSYDPGISGDGRYVTFWSEASNLVPDDTNFRGDVFVHDRIEGTTERVSVTSEGVQGNDSSVEAHISDDGRFVAFRSRATNLVPDKTTHVWDIFVHDRTTKETVRASVSDSGSEGEREARWPRLSDDGRYVVFDTRSALVPEDTDGHFDIYRRDLVAQRTAMVSVNDFGMSANNSTLRPSISDDGMVVSFDSTSTNNIAPRENGSISPDVYVRDMRADTTEKVSVSSAGNMLNGFSYRSNVSGDGRYVTYWSDATNIAPDRPELRTDIFVRDRLLGTTELVSVPNEGLQGNDTSQEADISSDGRVVTWMSLATNLAPGVDNGVYDIYARRRGVGNETRLVTMAHEGGVLEVSGDARFSGAVLSEASDPVGDLALEPTKDVTGDIAGAELIVRPEEDNELLGRLHVDRLVAPFQVPGVPGASYGMAFSVDGTPYEIRVDGGALLREPVFRLFRCDPACLPVEDVAGSYGTAGHQIQFAAPFASVGATEGSRITDVRFFAVAGALSSPSAVAIDEVTLSDAELPARAVRAAVVDAGTVPRAEDYRATLALAERGSFAGSIDTSSLGAGEYEVWVRSCLGADCGAVSKPLTIGSGGGTELAPCSLGLTVEPVRDRVETVAVLSDDGGAPLGGRNVTLSVEGAEVSSEVTGPDGAAVFNLSRTELRPGDVVTASFAGDDTHAFCEAMSTYRPRP